MKLPTRSLHLLIWALAVSVRAAINLDGDQVSGPVTADDPSPIADPLTYHPDQHDCPLPCTDLSNVHSWITYFSVDRLKRCKEPMLLQFSVLHPLDDPRTTTLIRGCTLGSSTGATDKSSVSAMATEVENPKKEAKLFEPSLDVAPACAAPGLETRGRLELTASRATGNGDITETTSLLQEMQKYFDAKDNCNEKFLFGYHKQIVASIYIGAELGKPTVGSAVAALVNHLNTGGPTANRTVAQLCSGVLTAKAVLGIAVDTSSDLVAVQKLAADWQAGKCAAGTDLNPVKGDTPDIKVFQLASGSGNDTMQSNSTLGSNSTIGESSAYRFRARRAEIGKRATCSTIEVNDGDTCTSLSSRCGIRGSAFATYNPKVDCSKLMKGQSVCCTLGDLPRPRPNADGTCATHLIENGDSCASLGLKYGLTVDEIESFNKGKTWAWTECKDMLGGYNMCLSNGTSPLPPPQQGTECGPLVPGTLPPTDPSVSLADLNPCPLKACCSNWGFCGPFPAHCDIHAPPGGGPGSRLPGFQSTCISNCGNEIKQNSGPPESFERIGYYESWNFNRPCLWMSARDVNTDRTYTHIHWGFASIDPSTWKPVIDDPHKQWDDFKKLEGVKRILSFGGWAYSTEPATYNIIRSAIIANRETFASNLAKFAADEGIDGIDIDWEYPGAPDILVGGQPIGQPGDGVAYLRFLTSLKSKMGAGKSVSIAAPASYWYLKAFPIDRIAAVIDRVIYMTYDLHGQWDYGNVNAFDSCPSGRCIRSHVNLTETRNSLSITTKAGVPNNKIFVGESSYGRSFHMAQDGCWGPMCEFTGSRTQSDATPGRCTETGGYISNAEINELIRKNAITQQFHDGASNTDVILYNGDYVSYMSPTTKDTRRTDWKAMNFAGSIDWALDLQAFTSDDMKVAPDRGNTGSEGCVSGRDLTVNTGDLCESSCALGFCPESLCLCTETGPIKELPAIVSGADYIAWDEFDVDLNRLCKFNCKYGTCPEDTCTTPVVDEDEEATSGGGMGDTYEQASSYYSDARLANQWNCLIYKDPNKRDASIDQCRPICAPAMKEAEEEGRTTNLGCVGLYPLDKEIPWRRIAGTNEVYAPAKCSCDNYLVNFLADTVIEAMPIIAQIGCYIVMSALKLVLDVGLQFIPGVGKALDAGMDMATTAAQTAKYLYPDEEDPEGAFSWWLSPCGGTELVPDEIKRVFGILSNVADGVSSFKPNPKLKGKGKKGDGANPVDRSKPKAGTGSGGNGKGSAGVKKKKKCKVPPNKSTTRVGASHNTLRKQSCDPVAGTTTKTDMIVTSLTYGPRPTKISGHCHKDFSQACFHYSSAMRVSPAWSTLTCPTEAATTARREHARGTVSWSAQHTGTGWQDEKYRAYGNCERDEWPPSYLLDKSSPAVQFSGVNRNGQMIRWIPDRHNGGAGSSNQLWKSTCFKPPLRDLSDSQLDSKISAAIGQPGSTKPGIAQNMVGIDIDTHPEFSIETWGHSANPPFDDGLWDNPCWPKAITPNDPGFCLLEFDRWYDNNPVGPPNNPNGPAFNYRAAYDPPRNGV